jgi:hypothetical protein
MPIKGRKALVESCAERNGNRHAQDIRVLALLYAGKGKLIEDREHAGTDDIGYVIERILHSALMREIIGALSVGDHVELQLATEVLASTRARQMPSRS